MLKSFKNGIKKKLRKALGIKELEDSIKRLHNSISHESPQPLESDNITSLLIELINSSKAGSVFTCQINNMDLLAPVEILHLCPHCIHPQPDQKLTYFVETRQSDWLCSHLKSGDIAIDIGAAFGIITMALSQAVGEQGHVYSFEPSKTAQRIQQKLLELNNAKNVTIVNSVIADKSGTTEFIEYTSNNELTWASDSSTLASPTINPTMNHLRYHVDVITLDEYIMATGIKPKAIKMDIEGFELYALQGARTTLETLHPYICIDIHKDVKTQESALIGVEPYLLELGYRLKMEGHALYCTPAK
jgi:FkbM family methyltransferase